MMKNIDWANLFFGYMRTDYNACCYYRDGQWGKIGACSDEYLNMCMVAACLRYRQEAPEGLKAYRCPDGKVRVLKMNKNATRLQSSCHGIVVPELSAEHLEGTVKMVMRLNQAHTPSCESGTTLYIHPLPIGTSVQVGVNAARGHAFIIFVTPVGPCFEGGFSSNPYVIIRGYDRSAPLGTSKYEAGDNYTVSLYAHSVAHEKGYASEFYLNTKERKYIDECGAASSFDIKNNTYTMPKSTSTLPSITNKSLMQLAENIGLKVERRLIPEEELETFEEAGARGTVAVISPISYIDDLDMGKRYDFGDKLDPISTKLCNKLRSVQYGTKPDVHGWTTAVIEQQRMI